MLFPIPEPLQVKRINIAIADLPAHLSGTRIVQLSDLHYDNVSLSDRTLAKAIALSNDENPDLVVITGDFVTKDPNPIYKLAGQLQYLTSTAGIYGCLGNHDLLTSNSQTIITEALAAVGLKILWQEVVYPWGEGLAITGLPDFWSSEFKPERVLNQIAPDTPRIVLSHNPDSAKILQKWRVDLQLSGHTHGGQIVIPHYGPLIALLPQIRQCLPQAIRSYIPYPRDCSRVVRDWEWSEGWHQIARNQLYINRGLGTYFPGRFNCPPEITVITLE